MLEFEIFRFPLSKKNNLISEWNAKNLTPENLVGNFLDKLRMWYVNETVI